MARIAFFGGSFDPPHRGHLAIARAATGRLHLDRVVFAPVGTQPLKRDLAAASFADRLAMVRLAIGDDPRMEVSEIDAPRATGTPNYTVDTIADFRKTLSAGHELYFLLGADSFLTVKQWHRSVDLLMGCDLIVAGRPGFSLENASRALPAGVSFKEDWVQATQYAKRAMTDGVGRQSMLYLLPDLNIDISATEIRNALADGETLAGAKAKQDVLPVEVVKYIHLRGIYMQMAG
jgi:nicotinate-nucleotide adenylyltransferase